MKKLNSFNKIRKPSDAALTIFYTTMCLVIQGCGSTSTLPTAGTSGTSSATSSASDSVNSSNSNQGSTTSTTTTANIPGIYSGGSTAQDSSQTPLFTGTWLLRTTEGCSIGASNWNTDQNTAVSIVDIGGNAVQLSTSFSNSNSFSNSSSYSGSNFTCTYFKQFRINYLASNQFQLQTLGPIQSSQNNSYFCPPAYYSNAPYVLSFVPDGTYNFSVNGNSINAMSNSLAQCSNKAYTIVFSH